MNFLNNALIRVLTIMGLILAMIFTVHTPGVEKLTAEMSQEMSVKDNKRSIARLASSMKLKRFFITMDELSILIYIFSSLSVFWLSSQHQQYPSISLFMKRLLLRPIKFTSLYV